MPWPNNRYTSLLCTVITYRHWSCNEELDVERLIKKIMNIIDFGYTKITPNGVSPQKNRITTRSLERPISSTLFYPYILDYIHNESEI